MVLAPWCKSSRRVSQDVWCLHRLTFHIDQVLAGVHVIVESHYHLPSLWLLSFRFYSQLERANSTTLSGWPSERSKKPTCFAMSVLVGFTWIYHSCLTMWVLITYKSSWKYTTGSRWCIRFPWNLALFCLQFVYPAYLHGVSTSQLEHVTLCHLIQGFKEQPSGETYPPEEHQPSMMDVSIHVRLPDF